MPLPTATPQVWRNTGNWYRNRELEQGFAAVLETAAPGVEYEVRIATLDALPNVPSKDLFLSLACLGDFLRVVYLSPYSLVVPSWVASYSFGIWDDTEGVWAGDTLEYFGPLVTDDGTSIHIMNQAEQREILRVLRSTADRQVVVAGMWSSAESTQPGLMSDLDPRGIDDALRYVGCF